MYKIKIYLLVSNLPLYVFPIRQRVNQGRRTFVRSVSCIAMKSRCTHNTTYHKYARNDMHRNFLSNARRRYQEESTSLLLYQKTKGTKNHLDIRLEKPINLTAYSLLGLLFPLHHSPKERNCVIWIGNLLGYLFYHDRQNS